MRYRKLDVKIWLDSKFKTLSPLQPSGQALFLYLLTNPNTTVIPGLYRAGAAAMAEELGWKTESLIKYMEEIIEQGLTKADLEARVIFLPNAIKYNKPQSPNVIKSWTMHWDEIPECELKAFAYDILKVFIDTLGEAYTKAFYEAINKPYTKPILNQEQKEEQEQKLSSLREDVGEVSSSSATNCPHQSIIDLYHQILPTLPRILNWNKTRQRYLQQRWRENKKHQDLDHWRRFFEYIKESSFLMGNTEGRDGKPPFIASLEWLVKPNNFTKVIEGKYHGGRS